MSTPNEIVVEQFANAQTYADSFISQMETFIADFKDALAIDNPTIDVTFAPVAAPTAVVAPTRPGGLDTVDADLVFDKDGFIADRTPEALVLTDPDITIDNFTGVAPVVDTSGKPVLDFGVKPEIVIGDAPVVPEITEVVLPDAPTLDPITPPSLLTINTVSLTDPDLRSDFINDIENSVPDFTLLEPSAYSYTVSAPYTSALLDALKSTLTTRLAGGTGLVPADEAALWDRGRDRETSALQANLDQAEEGNEARGYTLPQGTLASGVLRARENYYNKLGELSRTVSIEQAQLQQKNLSDAVQQGISLESNLINYSLELEKITFAHSKEVADNAIQIYNAGVEAFKVRLSVTETLSKVYDTIIKGVQAQVDADRAKLAAEETKANINRTLVEQYKAQIEAGLSTVRIYEAQLQGARTQLEVQKTRLEAAGEAIRGFIAGVNAKVATLEVYKTGAAAEQIKMQAWATDIEGQLGTVRAFTASAEAFRAQSAAQGEKARVNLGLYQAKASVKSDEYRGWTALVEAEKARLGAVGQRSDALLAGFKADLMAMESQVNQDLKRWDIQGKQYEATQNYTLAAEKMNADIIEHNRQVILDAAKTAAQIFSQLVHSALGRISVSSGISASASNSVGWAYSNQTDASPSSVTAV